MVIRIDGVDYPLATTLRVAYKVQGMHNHKPYADVFKDIGNMTLEDQIGLIYASFSTANPDMCSRMTQQNFLDYYLDNMDLGQLMKQLEELITAIMGDLADEVTEQTSEENTQGN